jgi:hypothetical protein
MLVSSDRLELFLFCFVFYCSVYNESSHCVSSVSVELEIVTQPK